MGMSRRLGVLAATFVLFTAQAHACGVCIEDKMAATYDHAVMERASAQRKIVVFCEVKGPVREANLRKAAARVTGVDAGSVRISAEPAAVSFVVDPRIRTPDIAIARMQAGLGSDVKLSLIKTIDPHEVAANAKHHPHRVRK